MKRVGLIILLVSVVVLAASLSTARANQVWAENRAHARLLAAQKGADEALALALRAGLVPGELAPYRARSQMLDAAQPPSSFPILSSSVSVFYNRQSRAYRSLRREIQAAVRTVTGQTRSEAGSALAIMRRHIARARSLDVDTGKAEIALHSEEAAFQRASLPRDFRPIPAALAGPRHDLDAAAQREMRYVSSVLAAVNGGRDGVVQRARTEAAGTDHPLSLLGLITPRANEYATTIQKMLANVEGAPTAFAAAVKESHLHREVSLVARDYAATVPDKMIVVSTEAQNALMYQGGEIIDSTPVTTGGPELPTDHGVFHIYLKLSPFVFHSPWPPGSPYYYPPTPVQFWMPFDGGEGLHDASWRSDFGPGSNLAPTDLGTGNYILGTHGCVNLPFQAAQFVWDWAPVGTMVVVI